MKHDFTPLLPPGLHPMRLHEVRKLCVDGFAISDTRERIMCGLEVVYGILSHEIIEGELWIDGSFLTAKLDPDDVDLILSVRCEFMRRASSEQVACLQWFSSGSLLEPPFWCDAYLHRAYPPEHPLFASSENRRLEWRDWFGKAHNRSDAKGIAKVTLTRPNPLRRPTIESAGWSHSAWPFYNGFGWK